MYTSYKPFNITLSDRNENGSRKAKTLSFRQLLNVLEYNSSGAGQIEMTVPIWTTTPRPNAEKTTIQDESTHHENRRPTTIINPPTTGKNFAVFSCSTPKIGENKANGYNYVFYLPLTVKAWRRIGHSSIVLIVGNLTTWKERPVLSFVLKELVALNTTIVFIPCSVENSVLVSTVSRLFAVSLLDWNHYSLQQNSHNISAVTSGKISGTQSATNPLDVTNLLTTDADLWPLTPNHFHIPRGHQRVVMSTNFGCCGTFSFKGQVYNMFPMSSVVMSVTTWKEVMFSNSSLSSVKSAHEILEYLAKDYDPKLVYAPLRRALNAAWYMDQTLISVRIKEWARRNAVSDMILKKRMPIYDRVDRSYWKVDSIKDKIDAHLFLDGYSEKSWEQTVPLLRQMYDIVEVSKIIRYRDMFTKLLS